MSVAGGTNRSPWRRCQRDARCACAFVVGLALIGSAADAAAWGCKGHGAIAVLAEHLLDDATAARVRAILAASPIDSGLRRQCPPVQSDVFADASTWADDFREVEPRTAGQHFVDFPRALEPGSINPEAYCPGGNCVIDAIVTQYRVLADGSDARLKANALRFVIHFIGDIHQPLHAITNGDRGGNCVPVQYYKRVPHRDDLGGARPNLHSVWDALTIDRLMWARHLAGVEALASHVGSGLRPRVSPLVPTTEIVSAWAIESHTLARRVAYGRLPAVPPVEPDSASRLSSCRENDEVGQRMSELHEYVGRDYEQVSVPVIVAQLRAAGERLAAVLRAALPNP